jgi:hypothetical protein
VTKARLFSLLIAAALVAVFLADVFVSPGGLNDGGYW